VRTDVADGNEVAVMLSEAMRRFGSVDAVLYNATLASMDLVPERPIADWDGSGAKLLVPEFC
jgi:NADP-dependent 3-hydroxy acid dehydrogenase YdfG